MITVTEGAICEVQAAYIHESGQWTITQAGIGELSRFYVKRTSGRHKTQMFRSPEEAALYIQYQALRAGLIALFSSPELPELLPMVTPDVETVQVVPVVPVPPTPEESP